MSPALIHEKITKTKSGLLKGGRGRSVQVGHTKFVWAKIRDYENWLFNRGWPLNIGPFYTGTTIIQRVR